MCRIWVWLLAAVVLCSAVAGSEQLAVQAPLCQRLHDTGLTYHSVYACLGVPKWALLPALWTPLSLQVNCTAPTYEIFTAATWGELHDAPQAVRWCGFAHFAQPEVCSFSLSPFDDAYVGIKTRRNSLLSRIGSMSSPEPQCSFSARRDLSLTKVAMAVLGVALFTHAHALTASQTFRLGAGTLTFMSGAALVVAFVLMRSLPHKRKLAAAVAVSASSVVAAARWACGTWAPDAVALLTSRWAIVYFLVTGLLGLGVTYWLDDASNVKLNNTVCAVLHLAGLLLVFLGTTREPASLAIIGLLVASRVLAPVARRAPRAWRWLRAAAAGVRGLMSRKARPLAAAAAADGAEHDADRRARGAAGEARRRAAPAARKAPARELLLSDDEEREAAEDARRARREQEQRLLRGLELRRQRELEEERSQEPDVRRPLDDRAGSLSVWLNGTGLGQAAPSRDGPGRHGRQQQAWEWPSAGGAAQPQRRPALQPLQLAPAVGGRGGGWFSHWGNPSGEPVDRRAQEEGASEPGSEEQGDEGSPLHLRRAPPKPAALERQEPPPPPPSLQQQQQQQAPHARQRQQQQQQQQQRKGQLLYEDDSEDGDDEDDVRGGAGAQRSPWSQERLVVDITKPAAGAARRAAPLSGGAKSGAAAAAPARGVAAPAAAAAGAARPAAAAARQATPPPATRGGGGGGDGGDGDVSPLVKMGKIFSSESSRVIQIGKGKYEDLVSRGYTPDFKNGVLLPPGAGDAGAEVGVSAGAAATASGGGKQRVSRSGRRG